LFTILGITWGNDPILFTILGITWGNDPILFTILGITWGNVPILFTVLGITLGNFPILFTILGITWGNIYSIFPTLGNKRKHGIFPSKNPFVRYRETATSQNYPKKGISCPRFYPIMGKFPILFPTGNLEKFPVWTPCLDCTSQHRQ